MPSPSVAAAQPGWSAPPTDDARLAIDDVPHLSVLLVAAGARGPAAWRTVTGWVFGSVLGPVAVCALVGMPAYVARVGMRDLDGVVGVVGPLLLFLNCRWTRRLALEGSGSGPPAPLSMRSSGDRGESDRWE